MEYIIILLAAIGFIITYTIAKKKSQKKPLICPLRAHCDAVIHSEYSSFWGIHLEYIGMIYYAIILSSYALYAADIIPQMIMNFVAAMTIIAFLFSVYLTGVQAFVLKNWCTWCVTSAIICTFIVSIVFFYAV